MRKLLLLGLAVAALLTACDDEMTYADQKEKENTAISQYIAKHNIKVIEESEFEAKDSTTDVAANEYVLFESSGVYMQIVRKGCGRPIADGESATVLCRFSEYNLFTDSLQLTNDVPYYSALVEKMTVKNSSGTFSGSFVASSSLLYQAYSTTSIPSGWLIPLGYINVGRPEKEEDEIAKVNLIVPHSQGHSNATQNVVPYFYTITYQKGR